jgi:hypothetical protein
MEALDFEEFIPTYPEDTDLDVQELITYKNEFLEVSGKVKEPIPKPGQYYRHQKALFRYMVSHDRMLNIQETGTGKTCSLVAIAEYFKKYKEEKQIRHVYVLEKGSTTVDEFKKQIACNCTSAENNEYITSKVTDITLQERHRKGNLTRSLGKWYTIKSYGVFVSEINKMNYTDEQLEREFSGCIFFVDEAHNLSEDKTIEKQKEEVGDVIEEDAKQEKEKRSIYKTLWRLFHIVKRSKIILGTATPMINDVNEIAPIMNLILPLDQQMPTEKWNYENVTLDQVEPFFRGKVSYVRGLDTGAQVVYQGEEMEKVYDLEIPQEDQSIPFMFMKRDIDGNILQLPEQPKVQMVKKQFHSQSIVQKVVMSKFQNEGYAKADGEDQTDEKTKREAQAFYLYQRHAASFVFPDKSYSGDFTSLKTSALKERAGKYIQPELDKEGRRKPGTYVLTNENNFKDKIKNIDELRNLSTKYHFIVKNELKPENSGNVFCFTDLVTGSGAILFGKILEQYGFEKYKEGQSVFQTTESKKASVCAGDSSTKKIKASFAPKLRYGILMSKDMNESQLASLLELFNSYENRNGDYCKILIGTPASRDGINVFNVRRGYLMSPMWHPSGMHQALSRFIRSTSHQMLIEDEKKRLLEEGKDPSMASVQVKIYKMAAIRNEEDKASADLLLYQITERKDIHIRRMMRFLKQCAFDCPIHYERNIRPKDVNGTAICDYTTCRYVCARSELTNTIDPKLIDFSTYDILYSEVVIEECKKIILRMMKERSSIAIGCLYSILENDFKRKFINAAVESIVTDRLSITDRFGYTCFLNTNGVLLYTQADLPTSSQGLDLSDLSYYKDMLFGIIPNKFDDLINDASSSEQESKINALLSLEDPDGNGFEKFYDMVDELTESTKIKLLEEYLPYGLPEYINDKRFKISTAFYSKFRNYTIYTTEPKDDIQEIKKKLDEAKFKPGREMKETEKPEIVIDFKGPPPRNYVYPDGSNPKVIIIQTYSGNILNRNAYNEFSNFRNSDQDIRIYTSGETWRNVDRYEWSAYKNIVKNHTNNILSQYKGFDEFGIMLSGNKFSIVNTKNLFSEDQNTRNKERGMACGSFKMLPLVEILLKYNYRDPAIEKNSIPKELQKRDNVIKYLLDEKIIVQDEDYKRIDQYTVDKLYFIYRYSKLSKDTLCKIINMVFAENGLLLIL